MKTKFLSVSLGVAMILLAAGFFIRSFNTANAAPKPERFLTEGTSKIGKYSISVVPSGSAIIAIVLNTETGVSETYSYTSYSKPWDKLPQQLPAASF